VFGVLEKERTPQALATVLGCYGFAKPYSKDVIG